MYATKIKISQLYPSNSDILNNLQDRFENLSIGMYSMKKNNLSFIKQHFSEIYPECKIKWDTKLFCSCGCSPGYRVLIKHEYRIKPVVSAYYIEGFLFNKEDIKNKLIPSKVLLGNQ